MWLKLLLVDAYCHCATNTWQGQGIDAASYWCCLICIIHSSLSLWLPMATANTFSTLNRPDCHSLCRWCHYNTDTHPFFWHCLVWRHSPIIIWASFQSFALATQSTPENHLQRLVGALSKLGEYLCIMSDAFGPVKRQESGGWERQ